MIAGFPIDTLRDTVIGAGKTALGFGFGFGFWSFRIFRYGFEFGFGFGFGWEGELGLRFSVQGSRRRVKGRW